MKAYKVYNSTTDEYVSLRSGKSIWPKRAYAINAVKQSIYKGDWHVYDIVEFDLLETDRNPVPPNK